jgi:hypothetical protein
VQSIVKGWFILVIITILKDEIKRKNNNKKKYESTGLTCHIRLTHPTWDLYHESAITK